MARLTIAPGKVHFFLMHGEQILVVSFFLTTSGKEPVRDWLRSLEKEERKIIGEDIKLVQFRWPLGMPLVRKMEANLWEVRSKFTNGIFINPIFLKLL